MLSELRGQARSDLGRVAVRAADALLQKTHVGLTYAPSRNEPRWGYGQAMLGGLDEELKAAEPVIAHTLDMLGNYRKDFERIARQAADPAELDGGCLHKPNPRRAHWSLSQGGVEEAEGSSLGRGALCVALAPPGPLSAGQSEGSPGFRRQLCATATTTSRSDDDAVAREPTAQCRPSHA